MSKSLVLALLLTSTLLTLGNTPAAIAGCTASLPCPCSADLICPAPYPSYHIFCSPSLPSISCTGGTGEVCTSGNVSGFNYVQCGSRRTYCSGICYQATSEDLYCAGNYVSCSQCQSGELNCFIE